VTFQFIDCHGLAGGMSLGLVQSGATMLHRAGSSFGSKNAAANADLLGQGWTSTYSDDNNAAAWDAYAGIDVVAGNPPCSGFSPLSSKEYRGENSTANECMWSFVDYTARVQPQVAVFESVIQAFSGGLTLMRALRAKLEQDTGLEYGLYHIKHNGLGVGGAAIRNRYFWLVSQVPFGVEPEVPERLPTVLDSLGDLTGLKVQWEAQDYAREASWWSESRRDPSGQVDGHATRPSVHSRRINALIDAVGHWPAAADEEWMVKAAWEKNGRLPEEYDNILEKIQRKNFNMGVSPTFRWRTTRPAYVVTGNGANNLVHPLEPRLLTYRELFRVQGFPDYWKLAGLESDKKIGTYPGKGIPVDCGRWIGKWISAALRGEPGGFTGEPMSEREWLIDTSKEHVPALKKLLSETEPVV
jgi:site-specific DNA-cytosine methylase